MCTENLGKEAVLLAWEEWKSREPAHRKMLMDEFYRWLRQKKPELTEAPPGGPKFETVVRWLKKHEGLMG